MERKEILTKIVQIMGASDIMMQVIEEDFPLNTLKEDYPEEYTKTAEIIKEVINDGLTEALNDMLTDEDLLLLEKLYELGTYKRQDLAIELFSKRWRPIDILQKSMKSSEMPKEAHGIIMLYSLAQSVQGGTGGVLEQLMDTSLQGNQKHPLCKECGDCECDSKEEIKKEPKPKKGPDGRLLN